MSIAPTTTARKHHRAFRPAAAGGAVTPTLGLDVAQQPDVLAALLGHERLTTLAAQHGAQDQRERALPAVVFFWAVVLSQGADASLTLQSIVTRLTAAAAMLGRTRPTAVCSRRTVSYNLTERPWTFFQAVYADLVEHYGALLAAHAGVAYVQWLRSLVILDATVIRVANTLIQTWPAIRTGRNASWGAVKVHTAFWLCRGVPNVLTLTPQKTHDTKVDGLRAAGEAALYVFDLGYWSFKRLATIIERQQHFVSRLKSQNNPLIIAVYEGEAAWVGQRLKTVKMSGTEVDLEVNLTGPYTSSRPLKPNVRLVGQQVNAVWHLYITNLTDRTVFTVDLIRQIYALRWQIELLFKHLKSVLHMKNLISTSENGVRIQIYAALILYVLTRLVLLKTVRAAQRPLEAFSLPKCLQAVVQGGCDTHALLVKGQAPDWHEVLQRLMHLVQATARRDNPKRGHPLTKVNQALSPASGP